MCEGREFIPEHSRIKIDGSQKSENVQLLSLSDDEVHVAITLDFV